MVQKIEENRKKLLQDRKEDNKRSGVNFEVIGFSEVDKFAIELYNLNFPNIKNYGDITKLEVEDIDDFDLFCGGFPCQPFSKAGISKRKNLKRAYGFEDKEQGDLFFNILDILNIKKPTIVSVMTIPRKSVSTPFGGLLFMLLRQS